MQTHRISIIGRKGGIGKTALSVGIASACAHAGRRTVLVDLDPQGSSSRWLGGGRAEDGRLPDAFEEGGAISDLAELTAVPGLAIIRADVKLDGFERGAGSDPLALSRVCASLETANQAGEVVIFDTGPSLGLLSTAALMACHGAIVVALAEGGAVDVLADSIKRVREVESLPAYSCRLLGVALNRVDRRLRDTAGIAEGLRERLGDVVFESEIATSGEITAAQGRRRPILAPSRREFAKLALEALGRLEEDHSTEGEGAA